MATHYMYKSFNRAFTVVELLVVITVIGILAAIVVVSYSGSQARANRSSINATAQQVKLKLGDYYTDKNYYPDNGIAAIQYLNDSGSSTLADAVNATYNGQGFNYYICATGTAPASCSATSCGSPSTCTVYRLTISKAAWRGDASDSDITVTP